MATNSADLPKGQRWLSVRSRRARFNRSGLRFASHFATTVSEKEIGTERFERLLEEPQLRCQLIPEPPPPPKPKSKSKSKD